LDDTPMCDYFGNSMHPPLEAIISEIIENKGSTRRL
jgi:hypothetical protein